MRHVFHSLGHMFVVLMSAKSNDITKSILVQKIAYSSIYDIIISRPLIAQDKLFHRQKAVRNYLIPST